MKNWHLIDIYKYAENIIICVCGWEGDADAAWLNHRKEKQGEPAPKGFNKRNYAYAPGIHNVPRKKKTHA